MRHSNRIGYALLLVIGMGLLLSYQNCSDPKLVKVKASNVPKCLDENKNLTIVSSVNTTASSLSEGRSDFQVFEVKDGVLKAFVPESPDSNIVPEWTKNDNPPQLPPLGDDELKSFNGIAGVIYNTNLEYNDCRAEEIKAKMQICGNDLVLNKSFMVGNCLPIQCEEHGVVAEFGELGEFFKAGDCDGGCQSIKRLCQANGEFGPPVDENGNPIEANVDEYQEASCRVDTPVGGCPIDPEDGGPGPQENLVCPQIPGSPSDWINKYGCREDLGRCGFPFPVNAQKKILLSEDSPQAGGVMRIKPVSTFDGMLNYFADTALLHGTEGQLVYSSISKCPNDFGVDNKAYFPMGRCKATSAGAHLQFKVIEQQDVGSLTERDLAGWCILIKDKTYYFNTTVYDGFMDGMLPLTPGARCDADTCGIIGGSLYD